MRYQEPWVLVAADIRPGKPVVDGVCARRGENFKTLLVELRGAGQPPTPTTPTDATGIVLLQLQGQNPGAGWYCRRFALTAWGAVSIQVDQFATFSLQVVSSTLAGFDVVAVATDGEEASTQPLLLYPETVAAPAITPWGAVELVPAQNDALFAWQLGTVIVPVALVAGVAVQVAGLRYVPTVFPFSATWRIRP